MKTLYESILDDDEDLLSKQIVNFDPEKFSKDFVYFVSPSEHGRLRRNITHLQKVLEYLYSLNKPLINDDEFMMIKNQIFKQESSGERDNALYSVMLILCTMVYETKELFAAEIPLSWTAIGYGLEKLQKQLEKLSEKSKDTLVKTKLPMDQFHLVILNSLTRDEINNFFKKYDSIFDSANVYTTIFGWKYPYIMTKCKFIWIPKSYPAKYKKIIKEIIKLI